MTKSSNQKAGVLIHNRVAFQGNNFSGYVISPNCEEFSPSTGRLDSHLALQMATEFPDYIVYSYGTPIAWHGKFGWTIPNVKYSVTTSKHQTYVRRAI